MDMKYMDMKYFGGKITASILATTILGVAYMAPISSAFAQTGSAAEAGIEAKASSKVTIVTITNPDAIADIATALMGDKYKQEGDASTPNDDQFLGVSIRDIMKISDASQLEFDGASLKYVMKSVKGDVVDGSSVVLPVPSQYSLDVGKDIAAVMANYGLSQPLPASGLSGAVAGQTPPQPANLEFAQKLISSHIYKKVKDNYANIEQRMTRLLTEEKWAYDAATHSATKSGRRNKTRTKSNLISLEELAKVKSIIDNPQSLNMMTPQGLSDARALFESAYAARPQDEGGNDLGTAGGVLLLLLGVASQGSKGHGDGSTPPPTPPPVQTPPPNWTNLQPNPSLPDGNPTY